MGRFLRRAGISTYVTFFVGCFLFFYVGKCAIVPWIRHGKDFRVSIAENMFLEVFNITSSNYFPKL